MVYAPKKNLALPFSLVAVLLAGCGTGGAGPAPVRPPRATAASSRICSDLHRSLPQELDGQRRRPTSPDSPMTAAWGDPAITLQCGVARPAIMDPGSSSYDPLGNGSDWAEVDGVCWISVGSHRPGSRTEPYVFYATRRKVFVEVYVPVEYAGGESPVDALSPVISKRDPQAPGDAFLCS